MFRRLFSRLRVSPRVLYAGSKLLFGAVLIKASEYIKVFTGEHIIEQDADIIFDREDNVNFSPTHPVTFAGFLEGVAQGMLLSAGSDVVQIAAGKMEEWICKRNPALNTSESNQPEPDFTLIKNRKKQDQQRQEHKRNLEKREIAKRQYARTISEQQALAAYQRRQFLFLGKKLLDLVFAGYFLVSSVQQLRDYFNLLPEKSEHDKNVNQLRSTISNSDITIFKEPESVFYQFILSNANVVLALGLLGYRIIESKLCTSHKNVRSEIPLARLLSSAGFMLLAEASFVKHARLKAQVLLTEHFKDTVGYGQSVAMTIAAGLYERLILQGVDTKIAHLRQTWAYHEAITGINTYVQNWSVDTDKWYKTSIYIKWYGKLRLFESGQAIIAAFLDNRRRHQSLVAATKQALTLRAEVRAAVVFRYSLACACDNRPALAKARWAGQDQVLVQEPMEDDADRERRQQAKERIRTERDKNAATRETEEAQKLLQFTKDEKKKEEQGKITQQTHTLHQSISKLSGKKPEILWSLLKKGTHKIDAGQLTALITVLEPFTLKDTTDGWMIWFDGQPIDSFHKEHGKPISERVFNKIREILVERKITEDTLPELFTRPSAPVKNLTIQFKK